MLGVVLLLVAAAAGTRALRALVHVDERHALAGLFGEPERERVIAARTARLVEGAESTVRIARFVDMLRAKAWQGVPMVIRRRSARWSEWSFADGTRWFVRHRTKPPRILRRVVVADATTTNEGADVDAYGPGGGLPEEILHITDVADDLPLVPPDDAS